jgi:hypothetical protein
MKDMKKKIINLSRLETSSQINLENKMIAYSFEIYD